MGRRFLPYLAFAAIVIGVGNFLSFMVETIPMNLIPSDGYQSGGHYFLWSKDAAGYVEVGRPFWQWIRLQGLSLLVTHPLAIASMWYVSFKFTFPSSIAGSATTLSTNRAQKVRGVGAPLAARRLGARIGPLTFTWPLVRIEVFSAAVVIRPAFMAPRVVMASEIEKVLPVKGWMWKGLEIVHAGTEVRSPIILYVAEQDPIRGSISRLADRSVAVDAAALDRPAPTRAPDSAGLPTGIALGLQILGLIGSIVLIVIGVLWLIPQTGAFGWLWTGAILIISAVNARRLLRG